MKKFRRIITFTLAVFMLIAMFATLVQPRIASAAFQGPTPICIDPEPDPTPDPTPRPIPVYPGWWGWPVIN